MFFAFENTHFYSFLKRLAWPQRATRHVLHAGPPFGVFEDHGLRPAARRQPPVGMVFYLAGVVAEALLQHSQQLRLLFQQPEMEGELQALSSQAHHPKSI